MRIALTALAMAGLMTAAGAHSWYPVNCCSERDCEALPIDGIEETATGWHVRYLSERFGAVDEVIPRDRARHSQDGRFHGCWRLSPERPRTICFFVPSNS